MRLYKFIGFILLIVLMLSVSINLIFFSNYNLGRNYVNAETLFNADSLKEDIDTKISIANGPLKEINSTCFQLVKTAYREIGNVGGEKYWSWYGFDSYHPWCSCFVSWCADQVGLIEKGIIPKFSSASDGFNWFMTKEYWIWGNETPTPGMIAFFDFTNMDLVEVRDDIPDHVGIVEKVEDGYVYIIEGNYNNACAENRYEIGHYNILGYGVVKY